MKLKSKIAIFFFAFGISTSVTNAQTIDSLNIQIDTTQNLQVNGSITIDSSLTVKDSVIMQDNLHVYEKLKLEEDAHLQKDVYIGNVLKVEGESYFNGNTFLLQK